jgi:hypothetical protein
MKLMHGGGCSQDPKEWAAQFADWNFMSLKDNSEEEEFKLYHDYVLVT